MTCSAGEYASDPNGLTTPWGIVANRTRADCTGRHLLALYLSLHHLPNARPRPRISSQDATGARSSTMLSMDFPLVSISVRCSFTAAVTVHRSPGLSRDRSTSVRTTV